MASANLPPSYASLNQGPPPRADTSEALPEYDGEAPPRLFMASAHIDEKLPTTFRVHDKYTTPLVKPSDLQAHLVLLGAFHRLREEVRTQKGKTDIPLTPDEAWAIFLQRAVYRFECWATRVIGNDDEEPRQQPAGLIASNEVPPLDVVMVWHTFMLNPRTYYDDCLRNHKGLLQVESFPLLQLASEIDPETLLPHPPSEERVAAFGITGQPFEPPLNTTTEDRVTLYCPKCAHPNPVPWVTRGGLGYAQRAFKTICTECTMHFTRETFGVRKFYEDMEKCRTDPDKHYLANTVVDYFTGQPKLDLAKLFTSFILKVDAGEGPVRPEVMGSRKGWTFDKVEGICRAGLLSSKNRPAVDTPRGLNIVLSAYRQPGPFSLDLASAVMRQITFVEKMVRFGWTEHGRFDEDNSTLTRSVARYHAFLDLMGSTPGKFVVPTLDIDLAWHTHQLLCGSYRKLVDLIGITPDHDDKVSQGALSTAYDDTAEAWKARFGVPYSVCGCLPPSAKFDSKTSSVKAMFTFKGKAKAKPLENLHPELVSETDMAADETHPSDHNGVVIINPKEENAAQAQLRRREMEMRHKDLGRKVEAGGGGWSEIQFKRARDHEHSFVCPVQYGVKEPFGKQGNGDCTVYSGNGVRGNFGAGECAKGNGSTGLCGALSSHPRSGLEDNVHYGAMMLGNRQALAQYGFTQSTMAFGLGAGSYGDPTVWNTTIAGGATCVGNNTWDNGHNDSGPSTDHHHHHHDAGTTPASNCGTPGQDSSGPSGGADTSASNCGGGSSSNCGGGSSCGGGGCGGGGD